MLVMILMKVQRIGEVRVLQALWCHIT